MKFYANDVTWLFAVRLDLIYRMENILSVVNYLSMHFKTNIIVLEASEGTNCFLRKMLPRRIQYYSILDKDPIFHRTKYHNIMLSKVETPITALWDTDVIVPNKQNIDSIEKIRAKECNVAFPYSGICLDTSSILRTLFLRTGNISYLTKNTNKMKMLHNNSRLTGGGFFIHTDDYLRAGGDNEVFYGWGPEDFERYERFKLLNYSIYRNTNCMFHLTHPRNINSSFNSTLQKCNLNAELFNTQNSSKEELELTLKNKNSNN